MPSPSARPPVIIGTRGSPLALAQAALAAERIRATGLVDAVSIRSIRTAGDRNLTDRIDRIGGKGVFCREIEQALLSGEIDIAVHSLKDMPVTQPPGLCVDCVLPRTDPRDALVCRHADSIDALPDGSRIGTSSLRRRAQLLFRNRNLAPVEFRGNLDTRLNKLRSGEVDACVLAMAGLTRLGRLDEWVRAVPIDVMLPAAAQGIIGLERRSDDARTAEILHQANDRDTLVRSRAERSVLAALGADCATPIGVYAELANGRISLTAEYLRPDGSAHAVSEAAGGIEQADSLGHSLARCLLKKIASPVQAQ
ncbi:MAG: hydroxymethylbilane synthase [Rhodobacteraceae bacterium]|nr:hydroxymethylbilane synthase [Paracoccaceae bacterium]